ncbi:hypothetical protein TREMEDRAFT_38601 [Tremella mesenterica DSM 1558]|uniref:uncharacterized protein n=1 Tax=Tremella mesenterica (strain ATCC 24925 / CBS 8224 / DSM 1558 / NBRC 9311 / NRRL Y-6157 / RJB 2259-6 / UBC 559-6) TaxID=578456 RepID=UPI0003F4A52D|nr:uncharacterized protein TREMEDRAFT_38601 [Tremella mesenterica DSM 1558]EIW69932.1 hypothetical protein TREMEDRAFT_38601 [Tremella mesenterica DSM 1558]
MPPRTTRPPTTESLLPPILDLLTSSPPNPYSAHQKALTTTARLVHSDHVNVALDILFATARELLKLGEAASGVELGVRMTQIMTEGDVAVDQKTLASLTQLLALTPPSGPWRKKLVDAAIRWTQVKGTCPTGDPGLHQYVGEMNYKDRLYTQAEHHLLASGKRDAAITLAEMMFDWCEKGVLDPSPYALRGTLPFLTHRPPSILPALTFLTTFLNLLSTSSTSSKIFITNLPSHTLSTPEIHLTTSPTLNFLQLALLTVQRAPAPGVSPVQARGMTGGVGREWESLVGRYRRISGLDGVLNHPEAVEVMDKIGQEVFLIPPRGGSGGGDLLQNLMGSFFGSGGSM